MNSTLKGTIVEFETVPKVSPTFMENSTPVSTPRSFKF